MTEVEVAGRKIGSGHPCFIIAEAGVNHNGDVEMAKRLVDVAAEAGADAVKFQTFKAEQVVSAAAPKAEYQVETTGSAQSQLEMLQALELSREAHIELQAYCRERGVLFMSTPFDEGSADLLVELDVPVLKIPSGEVTSWPFLEYIARKGKPVIFSTGMSYLSEVEDAVRVLRQAGCDQMVLLHCVSNYPTDPADTNLRAMETMAAAFNVPVGYSDHTQGIEVPLAAVAMGASAIEKHFTLDRTLPGPDHRASLEPEELRAMVKGIRTVQIAFGNEKKAPAVSELPMRAIARRSLTALRNIPAGVPITQDMVGLRRPGTGIQPPDLPKVVGLVPVRPLDAGETLTWDHFHL